MTLCFAGTNIEILAFFILLVAVSVYVYMRIRGARP